jgi:hypothetical protein
MTMKAINIRKLKFRNSNGYNINAGGENLHVLLFPTMKPIDKKDDAE